MDGYSTDMVLRLEQLRSAPLGYSWKITHEMLVAEYGSDLIPAKDPEKLRRHHLRKKHVIVATPVVDSNNSQSNATAIYHAPASGACGVLPQHNTGGPFDLPSSGYHSQNTAPRSDPGSAYGATPTDSGTNYTAHRSGDLSSLGAYQSSLGGALNTSQPPPWAQHAATQRGYGGPDTLEPDPWAHNATTQFGHRTLDTLEPDPWVNNTVSQQGHGGSYASTLDSDTRLPPIVSFDPSLSQNYNNAASQAMTSDMRQPTAASQAGSSGLNNQIHGACEDNLSEQAIFDQQYQVSRRQRDWLPYQGNYISDGDFEGDIADDGVYEESGAEFGDYYIPSRDRVMKELEEKQN